MIEIYINILVLIIVLSPMWLGISIEILRILTDKHL